ncbi:ATP-dependent zinc protease [Roseibacillus ishigakijimensis]|uniref:ATP-dependent zinc protease n=2 Tax=Roseibacillus ishigakijimensis TaxID=454146 RepID=A0A934RKN2_9BACT|nr:ATP-dependent zinc protease [Roseibacillus ishigakijimensis]
MLSWGILLAIHPAFGQSQEPGPEEKSPREEAVAEAEEAAEQAEEAAEEAKVAAEEAARLAEKAAAQLGEVEAQEGAESAEEGAGEVVETSESEKAAEAAEEERDKANEVDPSEVRQILGWKEWVQVGSVADKMRAKLDSGARTSSLHAENIEEFERDGRRWVQFTLGEHRDKDAKSVLIKAPVQRVARVKNTDGTMERRYVVELNFQVGDRKLRDEFTLNDRSGMTCPVLLGRNALRHLGFVDCGRVDLAPKKLYK